MPILISVIIITRNRCGYLPSALEGLAGQSLSQESFEVIVVDNASGDDTAAVAKKNLQRFRHSRYLYEPVRGFSPARNTGWKNAAGEYIAYLDDDAVPEKEWLENILRAFRNADPEIGGIGGKVEVVLEIKPDWITEKIPLYYSAVDWGTKPFYISSIDQWIVGANIAFPRRVLEYLGGFLDIITGWGDDTYMLLRILKEKKRLLYDPSMKVKHYIGRERISKKWFIQRWFWHGTAVVFVESQFKEKSYRRRVKEFLQEIPGVLKMFLNWMLGRCRRFENKAPLIMRIGYMAGLLGLRQK